MLLYMNGCGLDSCLPHLDFKRLFIQRNSPKVTYLFRERKRCRLLIGLDTYWTGPVYWADLIQRRSLLFM